MQIKNAHIKNLSVRAATIVVAPTGLTSTDPSTSAWQIKQDYPDSADGVYWIQNANINGGDPVEIYADMTTDGGGWTLILQNSNGNPAWNYTNAYLRNETTPPLTLAVGDDYSIVGWADYIKRSASGFEYMLEAGSRAANGGIFTANEAYSFTGEVDLTALSAQGSGPYFGGTADYAARGYDAVINGSTGFRQNITRTTTFGSWDYANDGLEHRMPWFTTNSQGLAGEAILTTTNSDGGSWWGTLITYANNWSPAPWDNTTGAGWPGIIWYWVR